MTVITPAKIKDRASVVDIGEAGLLCRVKTGDLSAFEELYNRYVPRVYGLCFRMIGNPSLAEEITQDVFVRVWEKLHHFKSDNPFTPWLLAVAVNVVRGHRRSNKRKADKDYPMELFERTKEWDSTATGGLYDNIDIEKAIGRLPEGARKVFVLHDIEGYRHAEIAKMMGITSGTTKAQLHRARRILREELSL